MLSLWCVFVLTLQGGAASISAPIIYSSVVAFGAVTDTRDFALNIRLSFLRLLSVCSVFHPRALDFFFLWLPVKTSSISVPPDQLKLETTAAGCRRLCTAAMASC